nr:hypothetical protein [Tanacetum cinerariifolium]
MEYLEDTEYLCLHFTKDHQGMMINMPYPEKIYTSYSRGSGSGGVEQELGERWENVLARKEGTCEQYPLFKRGRDGVLLGLWGFDIPRWENDPEKLGAASDSLRSIPGNLKTRAERILSLFDLKEIEYLLHYDIDSSLKYSIDQSNLANLADIFVDSMPEMFTDEHALDYSSLLIFDEYDDDFLEVVSDAENVYYDPFDSKGEKIKEFKLLIDEFDLPCDFLPFEYDSFISQDFSRVDALPSTNNEEKVFNPSILSQQKHFEIITRVVQDKKLVTSNASLVLEDFDPPLYEPLFSKKFSGKRKIRKGQNRDKTEQKREACPLTCSKIMGCCISWYKGVVEGEGGFYPVDLMGIDGEKRGRKVGVCLVGNTVL